ncbi:MAG TPA: transglutaminase family protein [Kiritimatiellia bacterium]|mgnify:CR=1 FL=1|nr:transglutaminase family protein [Kiritimatiellia bacterium]
MKYRVVHRTEYDYTTSATLCHSLARLTPRNVRGQRCLGHYLAVDPMPAVMESRVDYFGNEVVYFSLEQPHEAMRVTATSTVECERVPETPERVRWREVGEAWSGVPREEQLAVREATLESPMIPGFPGLADLARPSFDRHEDLWEAVVDFTRRIYAEFTFDPAFTTLATPLRDVVEHRRGVCQDFAHLAIGGLRAMGLAARYVSGYLETAPPPGKEKLIGADASHAWVSVYVPGSGWVDVDPTNNQRPDDRYIVIGWGRDYADLAPLKGVFFGGGSHTLKVSVDVDRLV